VGSIRREYLKVEVWHFSDVAPSAAHVRASCPWARAGGAEGFAGRSGHRDFYRIGGIDDQRQRIG
jgi:hypothetical protein